MKRCDPQIGQIQQIKEAHAKALRGEGAKKKSKQKTIERLAFLALFASFAPWLLSALA